MPRSRKRASKRKRNADLNDSFQAAFGPSLANESSSEGVKSKLYYSTCCEHYHHVSLIAADQHGVSQQKLSVSLHHLICFDIMLLIFQNMNDYIPGSK